MPFFRKKTVFFFSMETVTILASNSPRRKELFRRICPDFSVLPADADERLPAGMPPREACALLAERKARATYEKALAAGMGQGKRLIVLGADTVVALDGEILGKPKGEEDAKATLRRLSGKTHEVYTGVCFLTAEGARTETERSTVTVKALTEKEIDDYVATGSPLDKAGAYGIQDGAVVEKYEGSFTNVVGLPVEITQRMYEEVKKC